MHAILSNNDLQVATVSYQPLGVSKEKFNFLLNLLQLNHFDNTLFVCTGKACYNLKVM